MNLPELPEFDIPKGCERPSREMTREEYLDWIGGTVRRLKESGQYREFRDRHCFRPGPEPFVIREDAKRD